MKYVCALVLAAVCISNSMVWADAGVFTGTGQNLRQITSESVQLVSIDVTITLERGPALFDGTSAMDEVAYDCKFVLHNLTDKAADLQVGFPIDSQFARLPKVPTNKDVDWVGQYSFNARDDVNTYHVDFLQKAAENTNEHYSVIFTWKMSLQRKETRTLTVQYRIPMSVGLAATDKRGLGPAWAESKDHPWMRLISTGMAEFGGYTTETGSSWSGNVEKATFKVITLPFEQYLHHRGLFETDSVEMQKMLAEDYPVHNAFTYCDVKPAGSKPVEDGIQWQYEDFKPKDAISFAYYQIQFPRAKADVDPWVDAIVRDIPDAHQQAAELSIVRQILLATYGQEPTDPTARNFAENQIWYAPNKDFTISKLAEDQQAVLVELDRRVASVGRGK